uniref:Uncharacterized protein n=1 Tax=Haptolina brevifila TaxID=156173 RepID=A0A7S2JHN7_9EUKA
MLMVSPMSMHADPLPIPMLIHIQYRCPITDAVDLRLPSLRLIAHSIDTLLHWTFFLFFSGTVLSIACDKTIAQDSRVALSIIRPVLSSFCAVIAVMSSCLWCASSVLAVL